MTLEQLIEFLSQAQSNWNEYLFNYDVPADEERGDELESAVAEAEQDILDFVQAHADELIAWSRTHEVRTSLFDEDFTS